MKYLLSILCLSFIYTQCNETNWQDYAPNLSGCTFTNADMSNIDFSSMNFNNVIIKNSNFEGSNFSDIYAYDNAGMQIINSNFNNTIHHNSWINVFSFLSNFQYCDFSNSYLNGYFYYSDLQHSNFQQLSDNPPNFYNNLLCDSPIDEYYFNFFNTFIDCNEMEPDFTFLIDLDNDTYDDESYNAGATSGDNNIDGAVDIIDVVNLVNIILD